MIQQKIVIEAYKHILQLLRPVNYLAYHNIGHTLDVFKRTQQLGIAEGLAEDELTDVLLGALFHDTGFVESYNNNEAIWARLAREWLQGKGFPEDRIKRVESIIMATIVFTTPKNVMEAIIQDADLDNFGRNDCFQKMYKVEKELREIAKLDTETIYTKVFRRLHREYNFRTQTAIKERQEKKLENAKHFESIYEQVMKTV
jgi:uncharacterized protein